MKVQRGGFVEGWTEPVVAAEWRSPRRFSKKSLPTSNNCTSSGGLEWSGRVPHDAFGWTFNSSQILGFQIFWAPISSQGMSLISFSLFLSLSLSTYFEIYAMCDWTSSSLWAPSLLRRYRSAGGEPGRAPCHTNERLCPTGQSASRKILKVLALNPLVCVFLFFWDRHKGCRKSCFIVWFSWRKNLFCFVYYTHMSHIQ